MGLPVVGSFANISDFASAFHRGSKHFWSGRPLEPGGGGLYAPASYLTHPSLKGHTIFTPHPRSLQADERLPVLVWANGLGLAWGLMFGAFLREIASHGYIVIANGEPGEGGGAGAGARGGEGKGKGNKMGNWTARHLHLHLGRLRQMDASTLVDAVRWAVEAGQSCHDPDDVRAHVDGERIALAGQSRGGLDAYAAATALLRGEQEKPVVRTVGLFNSGLLSRTAEHLAQVRGLRVPVFYAVGGPADIAYRNAEADWELLPGDLPAWIGNLDVGHIGTYYDDESGGRFVRAALDWLGVTLRGDEAARRRMLEEYEANGWKVRHRNW